MQRMTLRAIPALLLATFSGAGFAAGFAIQAQNGSGNGNAFAGAAAVAEDAGTVFFNPAGMSYLPAGHNVSLAATYLRRSIEFTNAGTTVPTFTGDNGGNAGGSAVIPAAYWAGSVASNLSVGLGISPTFGNTTEYDQTFIGRFSGWYADLKVININPSVSYKINDMVSLGGGLNYAKSEVEFRQQVPVGAATERTATLKGDGDAWGYNVGVMFNLSKQSRVGVSYRSKIKFDLKGRQDVAGVPSQSFDITSELETPDTLSLALSQHLNDKIELLADFTWTGWSSVQSLPVYNAATGVKVNSLSYNFDDTYRVGLGVNYKLSEATKLRAGVAYDKTPVQSAADTTMTLPDSDRTWLSFGAKFTLSKANSVDVGYSHIFFDKASTARAVTYTGGQAPFSHTVRGDFDTSADYLSVQYNHTF